MESSRNKCRVCLRVENSVPLLNWNLPIEDINESLSYAICFQQCTQLNLVLNRENVEKESSMIIYEYFCYSCAAKLKEAYVFIKKAKETDSILRMNCGELDLCFDKKTFEWVEVEKKFSCVDLMKKGNEEEFLEENVHFQDSTPKYIQSKISIPSSIISTDVEKKISACSKMQRKIESMTCKICGNMISERQFLQHSCDKNKNPYRIEDAVESITNVIEETTPKITPNISSIHASIKKKMNNSTKAKRCSENKNNNEILSCKICGLSMTGKQLMRHPCNRGSEKFLCKSCPRTFRHRNTLIQHELIHEINRERKFTCSVCDRKFYTQMARRNHLKTHDPSRKPRFHCVDCGQSFLFKGNLLVHQQKHAGQTIQCNYCQKRYVRSVDLEVHLRSHTGDMPFKCDKCEKAFTKRSTLQKHLQLHDGVQWKCEDCGKEYLYEWTLQRHRLEHTGLPLKCSICEKEFPEMYKIKRHIKCVHKVNLLELENFVVRLKENKKRIRIPEIVSEAK